MGAANEAGAPDTGAPVVSYCADATIPKRIAATGLTFMDLALRGGTLVAAGITASEINPPHNDGAVVAIDLATSASRTLAMNLPFPKGISLGSQYAFWFDGGLARAALDGSGTAEVIAAGETGDNYCTLVVDDALYIAFSDTVALLPPGASRPMVLSPTGSGAPPLQLAAHDEFIYWASCGPLGIGRVPKSGGDKESVVANTFCTMWLAIEGNDLYFVDMDQATQMNLLFRVSIAGGTSSIVEPRAIGLSGPIAVDERDVYYAAKGGLFRVHRSGGAPEALATGEVSDVVIDGSCVYWADNQARSIFASRK
jgi:hypothetical protein